MYTFTTPICVTSVCENISNKSETPEIMESLHDCSYSVFCIGKKKDSKKKKKKKERKLLFRKVLRNFKY